MRTGIAYAGGCQKGKQAFGWNWNVANSRQALVHGDDGSYHVVTLSGSDAETIVRPLTKGHYQVYVLNTSGIGFVNGFTWSPPRAGRSRRSRRRAAGTASSGRTGRSPAAEGRPADLPLHLRRRRGDDRSRRLRSHPGGEARHGRGRRREAPDHDHDARPVPDPGHARAGEAPGRRLSLTHISASAGRAGILRRARLACLAEGRSWFGVGRTDGMWYGTGVIWVIFV